MFQNVFLDQLWLFLQWFFQRKPHVVLQLVFVFFFALLWEVDPDYDFSGDP